MVAFAFASPAADIEQHRRCEAKRTPSPLDHIPVRRQAPVLRFVPNGDDTRPHAESRDPCCRCGTRGELGCAHQRPWEPPHAGDAAAQVVQRALPQAPLGRVPFTPDEDRRVVELRGEGLTLDQIGQRIGRSGSAVSTCLVRLRAAGMEIPGA